MPDKSDEIFLEGDIMILVFRSLLQITFQLQYHKKIKSKESSEYMGNSE